MHKPFNAARAPTRLALVTGLLAAGPATHALTLVGTQPGGHGLSVALDGPRIGLDLALRGTGSAHVALALEASDVGQWLPFNAVIGVAPGQPLSALRVSLQGAGFAWVGTVTPAFGLLAGIEGDDRMQTLRFEPAEPFGLDLGAPSAQAGTQDWLLAPAPGLQAGDRFTLTVSAVPEPATAALMLAGLGVAAWAARRIRPSQAAAPARPRA